MRESDHDTGRRGEDISPVPKPAAPTAPASTEPVTPDEAARIRQLFEQARQRVKPLIKREGEAEVLTDDVLNFRLSRM
jgi:hypothetical protein